MNIYYLSAGLKTCFRKSFEEERFLFVADHYNYANFFYEIQHSDFLRVYQEKHLKNIPENILKDKVVFSLIFTKPICVFNGFLKKFLQILEKHNVYFFSNNCFFSKVFHDELFCRGYDFLLMYASNFLGEFSVFKIKSQKTLFYLIEDKFSDVYIFENGVLVEIFKNKNKEILSFDHFNFLISKMLE